MSERLLNILYQVDILIKSFHSLIGKFREPQIAHRSIPLEQEVFINPNASLLTESQGHSNHFLVPVYNPVSSNPCRITPGQGGI
jgi:hypothetical protein